MLKTVLIIKFVSICVFCLQPIANAQSFPDECKKSDRGWNVAMVQSLLNEANDDTALAVDGDFGKGTDAAVKAFQKSKSLAETGVVHTKTWEKLLDGRKRYLLTLEKEATPPKNDPKTTEDDSLYDAAVKLQKLDSSGLTEEGTYRGSFMPDDMKVKGRLKNGFYRLSLGFHRRSTKKKDKPRVYHTPTKNDLKVKTTGTLRPCLVVNEDRAVPVTSDDKKKVTSDAIHVHNGKVAKRSSDGCQTISPKDWDGFITTFLDAYSDLDDWSEVKNKAHSYRGKKIGFMVIK